MRGRRLVETEGSGRETGDLPSRKTIEVVPQSVLERRRLHLRPPSLPQAAEDLVEDVQLMALLLPVVGLGRIRRRPATAALGRVLHRHSRIPTPKKPKETPEKRNQEEEIRTPASLMRSSAFQRSYSLRDGWIGAAIARDPRGTRERGRRRRRRGLGFTKRQRKERKVTEAENRATERERERGDAVKGSDI
ncbi:hypothetical protein BHM03_00059127 [Ensete ventricosum]|nr:hypothetical protein BHM03_00059127 [Ensete ventricosum]